MNSVVTFITGRRELLNRGVQSSTAPWQHPASKRSLSRLSAECKAYVSVVRGRNTISFECGSAGAVALTSGLFDKVTEFFAQSAQHAGFCHANGVGGHT